MMTASDADMDLHIAAYRRFQRAAASSMSSVTTPKAVASTGKVAQCATGGPLHDRHQATRIRHCWGSAAQSCL